MFEGALDLSKPSCNGPPKTSSKLCDPVCRDSGVASSEKKVSVSNIHDNAKVHLRTFHTTSAPPSFSGKSISSRARTLGPSSFYPPVPFQNLPEFSQHIQRPASFSTSPPQSSHMSHVGMCLGPNSLVKAEAASRNGGAKTIPAADRISDTLVTPIRPFKMYPVDPLNVYSNNLMPDATEALSSTAVNLRSLYDTTSPTSFPSLTLTSLTSHILQRKRRAENRDSTAGIGATSTGSSNVKSSSCGSSGGDSISEGCGIETSHISTSNATSIEDSSGSDEDKKEKASAEVQKDDAYWDRRKKNNEAAKRSRDVRRQKEEEIAIRAAFLEQENLKLRAQVAVLKNETAKLQYMLYNRV